MQCSTFELGLRLEPAEKFKILVLVKGGNQKNPRTRGINNPQNEATIYIQRGFQYSNDGHSGESQRHLCYRVSSSHNAPVCTLSP